MDKTRLTRDYELEPLKPGEKPTKEDLEYLYLELNWSRAEIAKLIGKSEAQTKKYLSAYKFRKTQAQKLEIRKRTTLEKYGVENISQLQSVKDKKEQKALERYGCKNVFQAKEVQDKIKRTIFEHYGTSSPMQSEEVKKKMKQTNLERYGTECVFQNKDIQEKAKQTNLERYGYCNPMKSDKIKNKIQKTNLERYGIENPMQNKNILEKVKIANLEKYGQEWSFSSNKIKGKIKQTLLKRYGCANPMHSEEIKNKLLQTNCAKYGFARANQSPDFMQKYWGNETYQVLKSEESLKAYIQTQEVKTVKVLSSKLNMSESAFRTYCHRYNLWNLIDHWTSSYELELQELFPFMHKTRAVIHPYEIDLYDEEHHFGIEFNGDYWHSDLKLPNNYHQKKSMYAEERGVFLYHIWEHEWQNRRKRDIILSQIKNILGENDRRIYARECYIASVDAETARTFIEDNHIQGYASDSVRIGLYYNNELLSIMTFGKPRFKTECEWELIRFCNKKGTSVVGGASKLFKYFVERYQPDSILSYSHMDKGRGNLYQKLGFELQGITDPDYVWYDGENVLSRYQCQKHKLIEQGFEGNSEREIMEGLDYIRVFGCGNKIWIWREQ